MAKQTIRVLQPTFYDRFECIGPACPDTCCRGWNIIIDKSTYQRYRQIKDPVFVELCKKTLARSRSGEISNQNYAHIKLDEDGVCGFQQEDGLCYLHKNFGEKYLSTTCKVYPRQKNMLMKDVCELSLSVSCPEAARLVLNEKNGVDFELLDKELESGDGVLKSGTTSLKLHESQSGYNEYAWQIREACIDLMQCQESSVQERLLAVCMMLRKITELHDAGETGEIVSALKGFVTAINCGDFKGMLDELPYDEKIHFSAITLPLAHVAFRRESMGGGAAMTAFWEEMDQHFESGEDEKGQLADGTIQFVIDCMKKYSDVYFGEHPMALENYFANYMFSTLFPFRYSTETMNPARNADMLIEHYALLRIIISIAANRLGGVTDDIVIAAISFLSRSAQHSYFDETVTRLADSIKLDSVAYSAHMLR